MLNKEPLKNISNGVEFIYRGAQKRRTIALNSAKDVSLELGLLRSSNIRIVK